MMSNIHPVNNSGLLELLSMGFPLDSCLEALKVYSNNIEFAVAWLLEKNKSIIKSDGIISGLCNSRGFGFIQPNIPVPDKNPLFFHFSEFQANNYNITQPVIGTKVIFNIEINPKNNKFCAKNVSPGSLIEKNNKNFNSNNSKNNNNIAEEKHNVTDIVNPYKYKFGNRQRNKSG